MLRLSAASSLFVCLRTSIPQFQTDGCAKGAVYVVVSSYAEFASPADRSLLVQRLRVGPVRGFNDPRSDYGSHWRRCAWRHHHHYKSADQPDKIADQQD